MTPEPRLIYASPPGSATRWQVERRHADPTLISFTKWGRTKLLDQVARYAGGRWDPARWVPKPPMVPERILRLVVHHLQQEVVG